MTRDALAQLVVRHGLPARLVPELDAAYATPPRAYHSFAHVLEVCDRYVEVEAGPGWGRPREALASVLFHDAIYEAGRADNEGRSAALARASLAGEGLDLARVAALIELTARHGRLAPADVDAEAALFLDCDVAILGAPPDRFDRYEAEIAAEYAALPRAVYAAGRRAFLGRMLSADRIFLSAFFHARLDGAARANLRRALP